MLCVRFSGRSTLDIRCFSSIFGQSRSIQLTAAFAFIQSLRFGSAEPKFQVVGRPPGLLVGAITGTVLSVFSSSRPRGTKG